MIVSLWFPFAVACSGDVVETSIERPDEPVRVDIVLEDQNRVVSGTPNNERFHGTKLSDGIFGKGGSDEFWGGEGPDTLVGGKDDDRYIFSRGDGFDVITDAGGNSDVIEFRGGITWDELTVFEDSAGLNILVGAGKSENHIVVTEWGWFQNYIETFVVDSKQYGFREIEKRIEGNRRPRVKHPLPVQRALVGERFAYRLSADTFVDPDAGDVLELRVYMGRSDLIPEWLSFDFEKGFFSGTPASEDVGDLQVFIRANDPGNRVAIAVLDIVVAERGRRGDP